MMWWILSYRLEECEVIRYEGNCLSAQSQMTLEFDVVELIISDKKEGFYSVRNMRILMGQARCTDVFILLR